MNTGGARPPGARLQADEIAARSGSSFLTGFLCLDAARRTAMTAIYAFCRVADDAVDEAPDAATGRAHLQFWREELAAALARAATTPVGQALQEAMQRFGVRGEPLLALLDGVQMDLEPRAFADEAELRAYCWRVASAVGHACLPVLGAVEPAAGRFADALGQALQLTNILRDLRQDAEIGRIYVPRTWLLAHGVEADWLLGRGPELAYQAGGPVARLEAQFVAAAEAEFAAAHAALRQLPRASRRALVPARIMGAVYGALLRRLAARAGDVRLPRARVPRAQKLWLALLVLAGAKA